MEKMYDIVTKREHMVSVLKSLQFKFCLSTFYLLIEGEGIKSWLGSTESLFSLIESHVFQNFPYKKYFRIFFTKIVFYNVFNNYLNSDPFFRFWHVIRVSLLALAWKSEGRTLSNTDLKDVRTVKQIFGRFLRGTRIRTAVTSMAKPPALSPAP